MTAKTVLEAALGLSPKSRRRIAEKLLDSLEGDELRSLLRAGATLADERIRAVGGGKMRTISEEEAERTLLRDDS
jgi:hypothetical protein